MFRKTLTDLYCALNPRLEKMGPEDHRTIRKFHEELNKTARSLIDNLDNFEDTYKREVQRTILDLFREDKE